MSSFHLNNLPKGSIPRYGLGLQNINLEKTQSVHTGDMWTRLVKQVEIKYTKTASVGNCGTK